jgi:glycogen synthase
MSSASPAFERSSTKLSVLELGMGWFPEQAGGVNRVYHELVHSLPAADIECTGIITGTGRASEETGGTIRAVVPSDVPIRRRWRAIRQAAASTLAEKKIDVVAAHFALYAWPALRVIRQPFVFHFHGPWAAEGAQEGAGRIATTLKAFIERRVYRRADRLIVLSEAFKKILCESYGVESARVDVVPGGVDCDRYDVPLNRQQAREKLGWPMDRPIVLAVRRLVHRMGLEDLIAATAALVKSHPDLLVHIAGKGPLAETLQGMIADTGLQNHVRLLGYVSDDDLPLAYRAANVSIVPTVALEGFGLIAIESLAAGTPVIVTPIGGLPELVRGLSMNLICNAAGPAALQRALTAALANPGSLPSAADCQRYARKNFDSAVMAARTRAVYERAMTT